MWKTAMTLLTVVFSITTAGCSGEGDQGTTGGQTETAKLEATPTDQMKAQAGGDLKEKAVDSVAAVKEAQSLLDQARAAIQEKKFGLAESFLIKLEGIKGSLRESTQTQIDGARDSLIAAKFNAGVAIIP